MVVRKQLINKTGEADGASEGAPAVARLKPTKQEPNFSRGEFLLCQTMGLSLLQTPISSDDNTETKQPAAASQVSHGLPETP